MLVKGQCIGLQVALVGLAMPTSKALTSFRVLLIGQREAPTVMLAWWPLVAPAVLQTYIKSGELDELLCMFGSTPAMKEKMKNT